MADPSTTADLIGHLKGLMKAAISLDVEDRVSCAFCILEDGKVHDADCPIGKAEKFLGWKTPVTE